MTDTPLDLAAAWRIELDSAPSAELRATMAREINAFHSRTVPFESSRFGVVLRADDGRLGGAVIGVISWTWLFVEAVWVEDSLKGRGVGRELMARAEAHGVAQGCHAAWLDTFQARDFYLALGYEVFGVLEDYPPGQSRSFMRKRLAQRPAARRASAATPSARRGSRPGGGA
jgi:GNAT superfamily N-acetyltransferase